MKIALDTVIHWYETLTPASLEKIDSLYAADAYFCDPFNEVRGAPAIKAIMLHMFDSLEQPRFVVSERLVDGKQAFITWQFLFRIRGRAMTIDGSTHFRFADDGCINFHRDYWDAAGELYEKLPVIGWLLCRLRKKLSTPADKNTAFPL
jgi:ketosteroid isomerase-like protein